MDDYSFEDYIKDFELDYLGFDGVPSESGTVICSEQSIRKRLAYRRVKLMAEKPLPEKMIAACGNDCSACPRYVAPPFTKTEDELHHTAVLWMRIGYRDRVVTNQEIACMGCRPENWCRYRVIKCCVDRGIKTCGECPEYPCEDMKTCFQVTGLFEPGCREICTEDEYEQLRKAFFEKEKNLSKIRSDRM